MEAELVPDVSAAYKFFPHLPMRALDRPNQPNGLLLSQNAAWLLPRGEDSVNIIGDLRLLTIPLGNRHLFGGWHHSLLPKIKCRSQANCLRVNLTVTRVRATPMESLC